MVYVPATVRLCAILERSPRPMVSAMNVGVVVELAPRVIVAFNGTNGTELPCASATRKLGSGFGDDPAVMVTFVGPFAISWVRVATTAISGIRTEKAPALAV